MKSNAELKSSWSYRGNGVDETNASSVMLPEKNTCQNKDERNPSLITQVSFDRLQKSL